MRSEDFANGARPAVGSISSRIAVLTLLFSVAAIWESGRLASLADPAIWGHLRMGSWILENRSFPQAGLFSQASHARWMDFSWGFDLLVAVTYRVLGLRAIPALLMVFRVGLAAISFLLGGGWRGKFGMGLVVSTVTQYVLLGLGPSTAFVSMIFFAVELLLLMESRRRKDDRMLFWLPALFFLWANLDIEFLYGIAMLGLFLLALVVQRVGRRGSWEWLDVRETGIRVPLAFATGGLSLLATLLTPYTFNSYVEFFSAETSGLNRYLPGYGAMSFHQPPDYVLMLLLMAAFFSMGRQRSRDVFLLALLGGCALLSFHALRVNWLVAIASAAVIGEISTAEHAKASEESRGRVCQSHLLVPAGLAIVVAVFALALRVPRNPETLLAKTGERFPVRACNYIREHRLPAPLFNSYLWGAFLTWYLPEYPVAIDFRRGLYPEEEESNYFKVMNAELPYQVLPSLQRAGTLLLDRGTVMAEALETMPGFQVAYQDEISLVLLHESMETKVR